MFPILNKQALKPRWQAVVPVPVSSTFLYKTSVADKLTKLAPTPSQHFGWLTGSVLLLLAASSSPVAAQRVLFEETFANPQVNNREDFNYGIGGLGTSDPPCLTAAPLQEAPPTTGTRVGIPGCPTDTTNAGILPDPVGTGTLRLTPSKNNQAAFVLFNQLIPSTEGLVITFDFFIYNGSSPGADGISFFLIDANFSPTQAGGFGGSLGYAPRTDTNAPGIAGGYVGVGFDEFGNFSNPTEGRVGGLRRLPNSVSIRGRGGPPAGGYRYLTGTENGTVPPLPGRIDNPAANNRNAAGVRHTARITLTPDNQISVDIDFQNGAGFVNVIPRLDLKAVPEQGDLPDNFKFGFGAATGDLRNIHEIQNLRITTVPPDLRIVKTSSDSFTVGQQGTYTLTVRNSPSAGSTTGPITVTDTLPEGFNFISATGTNWNCSANGSTVTCIYTGSGLAPGEEAPPITITILPTGAVGTTTTVTNTATVTTPGDSNPGDNTAVVETPIISAPLLTAIKTAQLNDVNGNGIGDPGEAITYTIAIDNNGNAPSTNTVLTETVPANTTYVPNTTTLNGTALADVAGTTPLINGQLVNSPSQPLANGVVNPGTPEAATVTFQVRINNPLPPGVTEIRNVASVGSNEVPPITTEPPTDIPTAPGTPRLRLVKRITQVNTTPYSNLVDEPADPNDNPGIWPETLQPLGLARLDPQNLLKSGDEVEYTIYFISDGSQVVQDVKICDAIPEATTFIPNSFGLGSGILLNQGGTQIPQTNASDTDKGTFFSPLAPVPAPCLNTNNPNGSVFLPVGDLPNTAPNNVGFMRFRVKIN